MKRFGWFAVCGVLVLLILFGSILVGCTQSLFGVGQGAATPTRIPVAPPWFVADSSCQMTETSAQSRGDPHSFDSAGKSTGLLPSGQTTCVLEIQLCADMIVKSKLINTSAGEKCPESLHFSYAPRTKVCCAKWNVAKQTKSPCDPMTDMDCDGALNTVDTWPLDFTRQ
jgi:hypothetical protein